MHTEKAPYRALLSNKRGQAPRFLSIFHALHCLPSVCAAFASECPCDVELGDPLGYILFATSAGDKCYRKYSTMMPKTTSARIERVTHAGSSSPSLLMSILMSAMARSIPLSHVSCQQSPRIFPPLPFVRCLWYNSWCWRLTLPVVA